MSEIKPIFLFVTFFSQLKNKLLIQFKYYAKYALTFFINFFYWLQSVFSWDYFFQDIFMTSVQIVFFIYRNIYSALIKSFYFFTTYIILIFFPFSYILKEILNSYTKFLFYFSPCRLNWVFMCACVIFCVHIPQGRVLPCFIQFPF